MHSSLYTYIKLIPSAVVITIFAALFLLKTNKSNRTKAIPKMPDDGSFLAQINDLPSSGDTSIHHHSHHGSFTDYSSDFSGGDGGGGDGGGGD